jgi:hypothetical protein
MRQYAYVINCFNAILLAVIVVTATSGLTSGRASGSGHTTWRNDDTLIQADIKEPKVPA